MLRNNKVQISAILLMLCFASGPLAAAIRIEGQVQAGGGPLAKSIVTLWAASAGEPKQLAETKSAPKGDLSFAQKRLPQRYHPVCRCQRRRSHDPQGQRPQFSDRTLGSAWLRAAASGYRQ